MFATLYIRDACLCLRIDLGAMFFQYLGNVDLVFLRTEMHRRQAVLRSAVGVSTVVEQQSRYVCIAEWRCQMQRSITVL